MYWHADEIEWMWDAFPGKYAQCRVFALLYGLTKNGNGWTGDKELLAAKLRLKRTALYNLLHELEKDGFIRIDGKHIYTIYDVTSDDKNAISNDTPVTPTDNPVTSNDSSSTSNDKVVTSNDSFPPTPPNTNKAMGTEKIETAHTPKRDVSPSASLTFDTFVAAFEQRGGLYTRYQLERAQENWDSIHEDERKAAILAELAKPDGFWKSRPDWYIQDYQMPKLPPPKNYNYTGEFAEMVKKKRMVSAQYNGEHGIYTLEDAEKHHLPINYGMNFNYEQYLKEKEQNNGKTE